MEKVTEMSDQERRELEETVKTLSDIRGRHTELVSVLIPAGQNINLVQRQIEAERSTATNIKSKQTRNAVCDSLDMVVRELKKYKQTPPRGLAIFCGNISDKEGTQDIKIWAFEPPKVLNIRAYRCDQVFVTEPLKEMLEVSERYGLLVLDRQQATIGLLEARNIKVLRKLESNVPGKYKTGGQSAARFERIREGMAKDFFREVAEAMKDIFFEMPKLKGILIGGPIPTKEEFLKEGELVTKLKNIVLALKDLGYVDEHGLELLVEASQEDIAQQEIIKEKKLIEKFFETLGKEPKKVVYEIEKVRIALERGAIGTLLISKKLDKAIAQEFENEAQKIGSEIIYVSTDNQDGEQFFNVTKGMGAILRFQLEY